MIRMETERDGVISQFAPGCNHIISLSLLPNLIQKVFYWVMRFHVDGWTLAIEHYEL